MQWTLVLLMCISYLAFAAGFQLKVGPKANAPCKGQMCYEKYLDKMKGFLNGTDPSHAF